MPLPVQTSERSFYNAEIIKESKATKRLLSFVRIINPKEVRKSNLIDSISMTAVKAINHFKRKLKSLTKRKNAVFDTFLIQKIEGSITANQIGE